MFQPSDMILIDEPDYDPKLHQKPFAWEDLRSGEIVVVTVIGFTPVVIKANAYFGIATGLTLGGQANHEVDVITSKLGGPERIVVFKKRDMVETYADR